MYIRCIINCTRSIYVNITYLRCLITTLYVFIKCKKDLKIASYMDHTYKAKFHDTVGCVKKTNLHCMSVIANHAYILVYTCNMKCNRWQELINFLSLYRKTDPHNGAPIYSNCIERGEKPNVTSFTTCTGCLRIP
jgi:hypothetical protein